MKISIKILTVLALVVISLFTIAGKSSRWVEVEASAYCVCKRCCGANAKGITATGTSAHKPGIAVDPKSIPLGSRIDTPEHGNWLLADDTGGAIKGNRIDIRMKTHAEAVNFGRKIIKVRVWNENDR